MPTRPLEPVPGVCRVTFKGLLGGLNVVNTIHVRTDDRSPWTASEMTILGNGAKATFESTFLPNIQNGYTEAGINLLSLESSTAPEVNIASSGTGGKSSFSATNSTSVCITWKTAAHYRGGHARMYLVAGDPSQIVLGTTWNATVLTAWNTAAGLFLTGMNSVATTKISHCVLVRRISHDAPLVPPLVHDITAAFVDSRVDTQRRRLGKDR